MLTKTQGIVLQVIKHSDSGIIARILSREYGLISLMVKGLHSKRRGHLSPYFQPLQVLNIEMYYKESRNIQTLKETSLVRSKDRISRDISRNAMAFFMGEVLTKTLNENDADFGIYDYVYNSVVYLDTSKIITNFHISFLIGLSRYLGILPDTSFSEKNVFFDMMNGHYVESPPLHGYYMDREFSSLMNLFTLCSMDNANDILLNGNKRSEFLDILLTYYSLHLQGLKKIKSLEVLSEVFRK